MCACVITTLFLIEIEQSAVQQQPFTRSRLLYHIILYYHSTMSLLDLKLIQSDPLYYHQIYKLYVTKCKRDENKWKQNWRYISNKFVFDGGDDDDVYLLIVGAGEGSRESTVLEYVLERHPRVYVRVLEPEQNAADICKENFMALKKKYPSIRFEWYITTFEQYRREIDTEAEIDKYHLILCMDVLYYLNDLSDTLRHLYRLLKPKAVLGITTICTKSVLGNFYLNYYKDKDYPVCLNSDEDIMKVVTTSGWLTELKYTPVCVDMTSVIHNPMSEEANMLLDFITHVIDYRNSAPKSLVGDTLAYLTKNAEYQSDGKETVTNSKVEIIITKA